MSGLRRFIHGGEKSAQDQVISHPNIGKLGRGHGASKE